MIKLENVSVQFGDFIAIEDVNIEVKEGEFFTLLGSSGSGKSTTLRAIAGLNHISKGEVYIDGEPISHKPVDKRGIGMVFQSYALFPSMNVYDNIAFGLKVQKKNKQFISERVKSLATIVELADAQLQKEVSELSGGQQQRVAIARGLAQNPKVLLLDEPLSNLDARLRKQLRRDLKYIQQQYGITMIYVTHDQDEALTLSDQIAIFSQGKIEQIGSPETLYFHPKTEFVNNFLGETNQLNEAIKAEINQQTDAHFDANHDCYIREEYIEFKPTTSQQDVALKADVMDVEFLGSTYRLVLDVLGQTMTTFIKSAISNSNTVPKIGETIDIYINPKHILVFDQNGGLIND